MKLYKTPLVACEAALLGSAVLVGQSMRPCLGFGPMALKRPLSPYNPLRVCGGTMRCAHGLSGVSNGQGLDSVSVDYNRMAPLFAHDRLDGPIRPLPTERHSLARLHYRSDENMFDWLCEPVSVEPLKLKARWYRHWKRFPVSKDHARRHIVMAFHIRRALLAVRELAVIHRQTKSLEDTIRRFFAREQIRFDESLDGDALVVELYRHLHNLRCNIFIGDSEWNRVIGTQAARIERVEPSTIDALNQTPSKWQTVKTLVCWYRHHVKIAPASGRALKSQEAQLHSQQRMLVRSGLAGIHQAHGLPDAQSEAKDVVRSLLDSMSHDISGASEPTIAKWHNQYLSKWHQSLMQLQAQPSLAGFEAMLGEVSAMAKSFDEVVAQLGVPEGDWGNNRLLVDALTELRS